MFNYVRGFLMASPLLAGQVESINRDEIMLRGDICHQGDDEQFPDGTRHDVVGVHRGRSFVLEGHRQRAQPDIETYRAVLPSLGGQSAACWLASPPAIAVPGCCSRSTAIISAATTTTCCAISGPTEVFNPTIDPALIAKAREQDPESAEAEWDGGFRRDIAAFLSDHDIDAAVDHDRPLELTPRSGLRYTRVC